MKLYCVYDRVAQESGPVLTLKNDGIANRYFQSIISKEGLNPADYQMLFIGSYDIEKSLVIGNQVPVVVPLDYKVEIEE